jgi:C-terminal processing protease CtpA/Prc
MFITNNGKKVGYVRIFSFATNQPVEFARDFQEILKSFGTDELVIDIRNNPGGHIWAAEFILQCLSSKRIQPQPAQFLNSVMNQQICRFHSPSETVSNLDLTPWNRTFNEIKYTGTNFSLAYPITPESKLRQFISRIKFKTVVITDALCYSASDIFVSGFQDHELGSVLGVHKNTGAGGANVWSHSLLHFLTSGSQSVSRYFSPLTPSGANFKVAVRRTLRVGRNQGIPLEDLGVIPDAIHQMTRDDLLHQNRDLQQHACRIIQERL